MITENQKNEDDWGVDAVDESELVGSLDFDEVDPNELGNRPQVDQVGKYHFEISEASNHFETVKENGGQNTPNINVVCTVLKTVKGQSPEGSIYYHRLYVAGKGGGRVAEGTLKAVAAFLVGVGLLKKQDGKVIDPATKSTRIDVKTIAERLKGIQFIGDIKRTKSEGYDDKFELPWGRGVYQLDDPAVENIPKNEEAMKLIAQPQSSEQSQPSSSTAETTAPSSNGQEPATVAVTDDDYSDL